MATMGAKTAAGLVGAAVLAGGYVVRDGAVRVAVDHCADGKKEQHIHLIVPAALVPVGLRLVPEQKLREAAWRARPWLPAIREAGAELARLPDSVLFEVRDARQHVRMAKRGGQFILDVESPRETMHISFPLKTAEQVARQLESFRPPS